MLAGSRVATGGRTLSSGWILAGKFAVALAAVALALACSACAQASPVASGSSEAGATSGSLSAASVAPSQATAPASDSASASTASASAASASSQASSAAKVAHARAALVLTEDFRASLDHGPKGPEFQKYIVLHDTESDGDATGVVDYWENAGRFVSAHFVINKDGSIVQCVPLDRIGHHAGYGDTGHNGQFGVVEDGRDDMRGASPIGDWAADYGMNAWSVGIEMVHVGGSGEYPEAQLQALDKLVAYIDAYFGFESAIIDHKAWRTGNSDTSPEFAAYLVNYQDHRTHT